MGKSIDDNKITGGIPPNFDKKAVHDEELVDFTIEVNNVKMVYVSWAEKAIASRMHHQDSQKCIL